MSTHNPLGKKYAPGENGAPDVPFDYCMVMPTQDSQLTPQGKEIVDKILKAGFRTHIYYSIQRDEVLVLIGCEMKKLEAFADLIDYKMYLDPGKLEEHAKRGDEEKGIPPVEVAHAPEITALSPYEYIYGKVRDKT
jgi:hypothetical protein